MHKAADVCGACAPNVQGMLPENQSSLPERGLMCASDVIAAPATHSAEAANPEEMQREHVDTGASF